MFVGLILNLLQLFLCLTVKLSDHFQWRRWHKRANGLLVYLLYTQPIFLIYFWTRVELAVHLQHKNLISYVRENIMGIIIANHTYELDWLMCFLLADQLGNIGAYKSFAKDELKYLPVIGWSFWMTDLIYVKRNWEQDRLGMEKKLDELLVYDQMLLGIFAEGTRLTKEKYAEAREFAVSKKLEPYKYHLFPRARGFNFTLRHYLRAANLEKKMEENLIKLLNVEIVLPERPNFRQFLEGSYIKAEIYCEEVPVTDEIRQEALESEDAENCPKLTKLLQDIFRRKDEIIEQYGADGGFHLPNEKNPNGTLYPLKKPVGVTVCYIILMSITYGTFAYLAMTVFSGSIKFWTIVIGSLVSALLMLQRIERESKPNNLRMLKKRSDQALDPKAA